METRKKMRIQHTKVKQGSQGRKRMSKFSIKRIEVSGQILRNYIT